MNTRVSGVSKEVWISDGGPTVLIGERINPSGRKNLADALRNADFDVIVKEAIAHKILQRARSFGIPAEDVIIDCLALTVGAESHAGLVTLDAVRKVRTELGVNQTLGASNISFGLPERHLINHTFLAMAVSSGVTCPTVDVAKVRAAVLSIDLLLARDRFAQRYLRNIRKS